MTPEKAMQLETDIEIVKNAVVNMTQKISENTDAQKETADALVELVHKMSLNEERDKHRQKELDDRDERRDKQLESISGYVKRVEQDNKEFKEKFYDEYADTIKRTKKFHIGFDNFKSNVSSTYGKIFAMLVLALLAHALGLITFDLSKVFQ